MAVVCNYRNEMQKEAKPGRAPGFFYCVKIKAGKITARRIKDCSEYRPRA